MGLILGIYTSQPLRKFKIVYMFSQGKSNGKCCLKLQSMVVVAKNWLPINN